MWYKATVAYLDHRTGRTKWEMLPETVYSTLEAVALAIRMVALTIPNSDARIKRLDVGELTGENAETILRNGIKAGVYNQDTILVGYIKLGGEENTPPQGESNVISMFGDSDS